MPRSSIETRTSDLGGPLDRITDAILGHLE
jgi:hypothetical protein